MESANPGLGLQLVVTLGKLKPSSKPQSPAYKTGRRIKQVTHKGKVAVK